MESKEKDAPPIFPIPRSHGEEKGSNFKAHTLGVCSNTRARCCTNIMSLPLVVWFFTAHVRIPTNSSYNNLHEFGFLSSWCLEDGIYYGDILIFQQCE